MIRYAPLLFNLPQEEKDSLRMINSPHFLGYNTLGSEFTKGAKDLREQFDFATPSKCQWEPGKPDYWKLSGEAQVNSTFTL
jgi:isopenicillin N synthase-like dioxygenase